ncbi:hypothetical protein V8E53_002289 [Lactarius tabidus]
MSEVTNPKSSSDQFDALIELLATDDAADDSNFHIVPEGTASTGLRDASGKLDYTKIRSLFQQRQSSRNTEDASPDSSVSGPIPEIKLPEIVVEEPTALPDISPSVNLQPLQWVGESMVPNKPFKEGDFPRAQDDIAPQASEDAVVLNLDDALSKAYEEIEELQRRVLELETQSAELLKSNAPKEPGLGDCVSKPVISTLTSTSGSVPPMDRSDTERAIQFLIRADELVWRRSRYPNGPSAPVFSQDNIDAVTQRLSLWESIIRAPGPR